MSTNARITIKEVDGKRTSIYLHWDGYIERAGVILQVAYNAEDRVRDLIGLGDLSILDFDIEPKTSTHSFDTPDKGVCVAYHRDRGEELRFNDSEQCFNYLFDVSSSKWYVEDSDKNYLLIDEIMDCYENIIDYWSYDDFVKFSKELKSISK